MSRVGLVVVVAVVEIRVSELKTFATTQRVTFRDSQQKEPIQRGAHQHTRSIWDLGVESLHVLFYLVKEREQNRYCLIQPSQRL